jgi:hypothetical protein
LNTVATVAAVICVTAIGCSFVGVLVPQGSTKKVINVVIGVFLLCTMIVPIKNAIQNFKLETTISDSAEDLTASADEAYNNAVLKETQSILESKLKSSLAQNNINPYSLEINLSATENGGIYIKSISIYILQKDEALTQNIISITEEQFEIKPEVLTR